MSDFNQTAKEEDPRFPGLSPKPKPAGLDDLPVDPPPPPVTPPPQSKTPEDLLEEAKVLSSIPVNTQEAIGTKGEIPGQNQDLKDGSKSSAIGLFLAALFLIAISGTGGYFLGKSSVSQVNLPQPSPNNLQTIEATPSPAISPVPSPTLTSVGDEIRLAGGLTLTLDKVWLDSAYPKSKAALADKVQVNAQVTFANGETNALSYTPTDFILEDLQNMEYKVVLNASKEYKGLSLGSLLPGATITGGISFIVPKEETSFKLIYEDAEIVFSLP